MPELSVDDLMHVTHQPRVFAHDSGVTVEVVMVDTDGTEHLVKFAEWHRALSDAIATERSRMRSLLFLKRAQRRKRA